MEPIQNNIRVARQLRQMASPGERKLWERLRASQFMSAKFRRQMPIGPFFVDLACFEHKIVIEVDGASHEDKENYDLSRQQYIECMGWAVLRFTEAQVHSDLESVLQAIEVAISGE